jgi:pimeloyl-ACP methyl ester carboxylesterase
VMFHSHPYEDPEDKKAGRLKNIAFIEEHGVPLFAKQLIPNLFTPEFVAANPKMIKELVDRASKCAKRGVVGALQAMLERTDRSDAFKRLETPMLFIVGEKETVVPKDLSISQTKLAAASQLVMLPKENHMGMVSSVEESATAIMNFEKVLSLHI